MSEKVVYNFQKTDVIPPCHSMSRSEILKVLSEIIRLCCKKTSGEGRIRDPEADKIRIQYLRTAIMAASTALAGLKDLQLDEIETRLSKLEEGNHDSI
ncbi:hypothetical protein Mhun_0998 [Methanospirillum hungatei JF-1]|uniref:DUF8136 domain-containing protein n=1 Tax=Methanospirillum hungatei JF-1 (strain ATCC 27890 / DSM 864 / NBRC 100397 / JF-1) TaxID=323259 RepID=Q2FPL1_METHJ|nr:hypothetical protein [Methanospirillum hungatei]ABD40748.1 hypothetical protein Mhun_0998 [Methanospirillum hungatei JF-1]